MASGVTSPAAPLQRGSPVQDFELATLDGTPCSSRELRNKGLVLAVLFKTGCGTCKYTFPFLQRFQEQYAQNSGGRFHVVGISQNSAEETHDFAREYGPASFPILLDTDLTVTVQYGITHVPDLYLLGAGESIQEAVTGHFSAEGLNQIAQQVAEFTGLPYAPVVRPEDDAPALKPG